jgi:hypothetical protein
VTTIKKMSEVNTTLFTLLQYDMVPQLYDLLRNNSSNKEEDEDEDLKQAGKQAAPMQGQIFENGFFLVESIGFQVGSKYVERYNRKP